MTFLRLTLVVAVALIGAVAGVNYAVDPYGIYSGAVPRRFSAVKPQAQEHDVLVKSHAIERIRPNALLLGNSRTEVGLDPEHPAFPVSARPVYNAGLEGSRPSTALRYLRHGLASGSPQLVILGVDFLDFLVDPDPATLAEEWRNEVQERERPVLDRGQRRQDLMDTLFSLDALVASAKTMAAQSNPYAADMTRHGLVTMREYVAISRRVGYAALFQQKDREYADALAGRPRAIFAHGQRTSPPFDTLTQLIAMTRAHQARLILVIYPYHAHVLELFDGAGLWPAFEEWKRELVALLARDAKAYPDRERIALWDFSGYNAFTTEPVPARDDRVSQMQWYRDPGHFNKALGDRLLATVLAAPQADGGSPAFGVRLDGRNIEGHLARIASDRDHYRRQHADVKEHLLRLVAKQTGAIE